MTKPISRFSSRNRETLLVFLKDRLNGAVTYDRIAGYFRSSIFELVHEEISKIDKVRIVCNADIDPHDFDVARDSQMIMDRLQIARWHEQGVGARDFVDPKDWNILYEILTDKEKRVEIKVVSRKDAPFLHGKAGVITHADDTTSSFIGSNNETASGLKNSYEMLWEDTSREAAEWVQAEFDWLWDKGEPLSEAVIEDFKRIAERVEVRVDDMKDNPVDLAKSVTVESPLARRGERLAPWQKEFINIFAEHDRIYGSARLLLADEVGVGKTLSMAAAGALSVLMGHGPFLILCPATLTLQWQMELWDKLGLPSSVWSRTPRKGWLDHRNHLHMSYNHAEDVLHCPTQIGIVSTGIFTRGSAEAEALMKGEYGMVVLDEGHRARVARPFGKPEPTKLYTAMIKLAQQTRHLVIGTATPFQIDPKEIWDLMEILAQKREHVLGRKGVSPWWNADNALNVITGKKILPDPESAWHWLRSPLPPEDESKVFREIREDLKLLGRAHEIFTDCGITDLMDSTRTHLAQVLEFGETEKNNIPFMRDHNPLGRHVVLRRRKMLEDAKLLDRIAVNIHPVQGAAPGVFEGKAVFTPDFYQRAHDEVKEFTLAMNKRRKSAGFIMNLMMQRICSSVAAGKSTAIRMLASRRDESIIDLTEDQDIAEEMESMGKDEYINAINKEATHLERVIEILDKEDRDDPKNKAVLHYLDDEDWLGRGCIIFSQYYDTARWVGEMISETHPGEPVAVYAGVGKSGVLFNGKWQSISREEIKHSVRERRVRVVCATDAACEGINLQTLGTLINVDLPWNPSRLEQRIGRIKRYGQKRSEIDVANLVYQGTLDVVVYERLSERMKDKYDILGSLPDTIDADWITEGKNQIEKQIRDFIRPKSPADVFSLRYGDVNRYEGADGWEVWPKVMPRRDIEEQMNKPWKMQGSGTSGGDIPHEK